MFNLSKQQAKLSSFNPRAEKHGEENVPAGDIKFDLSTYSSVLDAFHGGFRNFLFRKPAVGEPQGMFDSADELTQLALPNLKPLRLDESFTGYTLVIESGLGISEPLTLKDVELSSFVFGAKNGGSVDISFSVTGHPSEEQAGKLYLLIQNTVEITLIPPNVQEKTEDDLLDAA